MSSRSVRSASIACPTHHSIGLPDLGAVGTMARNRRPGVCPDRSFNTDTLPAALRPSRGSPVQPVRQASQGAAVRNILPVVLVTVSLLGVRSGSDPATRRRCPGIRRSRHRDSVQCMQSGGASGPLLTCRRVRLAKHADSARGAHRPSSPFCRRLRGQRSPDHESRHPASSHALVRLCCRNRHVFLWPHRSSGRQAMVSVLRHHARPQRGPVAGQYSGHLCRSGVLMPASDRVLSRYAAPAWRILAAVRRST